MRADHLGFTLVEMMAALTLTGVILLGAISLLGSVTDAAGRIAEASVESDAEGASVHVLRAVLARAEQLPPPATSFDGGSSTVRLASWCEQQGGWLGRCMAGIELREAGVDGRYVELSWEGRPTIRLGSLPASTRFAFLNVTSTGGAWVSNWPAGAVAPSAVGLVTDGDTLLLPVGGGR